MVRYMLHFKYILSLSFKFLTFIFVLGLLIIPICFKLHLLRPAYKTLTPRIHVIIAYWKTYSYVTYVRLRKKSTVSICFKWPISECGKIISTRFYILYTYRLSKTWFCSSPFITINVDAKVNLCTCQENGWQINDKQAHLGMWDLRQAAATFSQRW